MKKTINRIAICIIIILITILISNKVEAKSYSIENMDIQATVNKDGSLSISQKITYKFNGSYNGIYINIPYILDDAEYDKIIENSKINNNLYTGHGITVEKVTDTISNNKYQERTHASNGNREVYTVTRKNGKEQIKVYSPSTDTTKTFIIEYKISNLCVKHKDIGELYYNFIGGAWEVKIKKLNIDIYLPNNTEEIKIWGHGPYNGKSKIIDNTHANFKVENVKSGQYVAARMIFDNKNIEGSSKITNLYAKEIIYEDEGAIVENREKKELFTKRVFIFASVLFAYWIILLLKYEKDKKYPISNLNEDELFEKYNPLIAGAIQGNREILSRDILAVVLGLIDKKIIKLDFYKDIEMKDEEYKYMIGKNPKKESEMDEIERYIYNWIFERREVVALGARLRELSKDKKATEKFKILTNLTEERLAKRGANSKSVPESVRAFNNILLIASIILVIYHVFYNGMNIYNLPKVSLAIFYWIMILFPLILLVIEVIMRIIVWVRHRIHKRITKITGKKIAVTTVSLLAIFGIMLLISKLLKVQSNIIADEILIMIATVIALTDNLMMKNSVVMIEDYSKLNALKDRIEEYTMMEDRDIEQIELWQKYLVYAVSFGIADKIMQRIKDIHIDDDIIKLADTDIMSRYITTEYSEFYENTSLDSRFLANFIETSRNISSSYFKGGSSSGDRWRFLRRRWLLRWRRKRRRPEEHSNNK